MIDLLKFYEDNIKEEEYYYQFYNELITYTKKQERLGIVDNFELFDDVDIIEKFKYLCQPNTDIYSSYNRRLFYFICFYLFKNGYTIKEFPHLLKRPPYKPDEFTSNEIKSKLVLLGKQRADGIVPYAERRLLIGNLTFEKDSALEVEKNIDALFEKISTRHASFTLMSKDERLKEIANLIEYMLFKDDKFKELDYSSITFEYITNDLIKSYRKKLQCFRHSSGKSIEERKEFTTEQKNFMIDYGITIIKVIYELVK